jgi:nicotinamide mononucleotide adenylyltransferase
MPDEARPDPGETHAVWVGRNQPFHLGHLAILRESLRAFPAPHVLGLVCQRLIPTDRAEEGKHAPAFNPFSPWERSTLATLALEAADLRDRVRVIFVPRNEAGGDLLRSYLPERFFRCTTDKDDADVEKAAIWREQGYRVEILKIRDLRPVNSSQIRRAMLAGADWRPYLHPATHQYFEDIDGPARLREAALRVANL